MKRSPACAKFPTKLRYATAVKAAYHAGLRGRKHKRKFYPEQCSACRNWHLTTKNPNA